MAERTVPDYYADSVMFEVAVYGVVLEFGQMQRPPPGFRGKVPHRPRVRIQMSPQHAKVMAKLFAKNVQAYEREIGKISIPPQLLNELGISDEW